MGENRKEGRVLLELIRVWVVGYFRVTQPVCISISIKVILRVFVCLFVCLFVCHH